MGLYLGGNGTVSRKKYDRALKQKGPYAGISSTLCIPKHRKIDR